MTDFNEGKRNENEIETTKLSVGDVYPSPSPTGYNTTTSNDLSHKEYNWDIKNFNQSHLEKYDSGAIDLSALKIKIGIHFDQNDSASCILYFFDMQDNLEINYHIDLVNWGDDKGRITAKNSFYSNPKMNTNSNYSSNKSEGTNKVQISMGLRRSDFEDQSSGWINNDMLRMTLTVYYMHVPDTSGENSKKETGYVGLKNQGATCYMNSMLQALFHLPAFRKIVYNMPTTGVEDETKCIPLNLQRLFCRMQFSEHPCSTKMLTQSFGWGDIETIMQHDVQEFCRVLIDNLEMKMKDNDSLATAIPDLFKGQFRSFVRCKNVKFETSRVEDFYDLTLQVKECPTLEASFQKYIEKEQLVGDNQYQAEGFGLQDAEMGVEFISLPSVLQLHLGRFEYNFNTEQMVKINDRFEFQEEIDLKPFLAKDADCCKSTIYELYGVLVHMGDVSFGHYYAFLRTSTDPQWYQFDDNCVTKAESKDAIQGNFGEKIIKKSRYGNYNYGGHNNYNYYGNNNYGGGYYGGGASKAYSAYMLFYIRKEDAPNIMSPIQNSSVPRHLIDYVEEITKQKELKKARKKAESSIFNISVITEEDLATNCQMDVIGFDPKRTIEPLKIDKKSTTKEIYVKIAESLNLNANEIRVWLTVTSKNPKSVLEMSEDHRLSDLVQQYFNSFTFFVQKISPGEKLAMPIGGIIIFLKFYFPTANSPIQYIGILTVNEKDQIGSIVEQVNRRIGFPEETKLIVFQENQNKTATQRNLTETFSKFSINNGSILILQVDPAEPQPSLDSIIIKLRDPLPLPPETSENEDEIDEISHNSASSKINETKETKENNENKETKENNENNENNDANNENNEICEQVKIVRMVDLDDSAPLKTVNNYYTNKFMSEIVDLFDYEAYTKSIIGNISNISNTIKNTEILKPIVALEFPTTISQAQLKSLICKAVQRPYDSSTDSVVLYRKLSDTNMPERKPIDGTQTNCFSTFQYQRNDLIISGKSSGKRRHGFFFSINIGVPEKILSQQMTIAPVDVSIDGIHIKYSQNVVTAKNASCYNIAMQLLEQFSDEEDRKIIQNEAQNGNLRFFQMQDHKYLKQYHMNEVPSFTNISNIMRIDVIPVDQRELKDDEFLIPITFLTKESQKIVGVGHPFFMILKKDESFKEVKPRILEIIPEYNGSEFELRVRSQNDGNKTSFIREELKDDCIIFNKYCEGSRIYLYIKKNKSSHHDQAVKIFN